MPDNLQTAHDRTCCLVVHTRPVFLFLFFHLDGTHSGTRFFVPSLPPLHMPGAARWTFMPASHIDGTKNPALTSVAPLSARYRKETLSHQRQILVAKARPTRKQEHGCLLALMLSSPHVELPSNHMNSQVKVHPYAAARLCKRRNKFEIRLLFKCISAKHISVHNKFGNAPEAIRHKLLCVHPPGIGIKAMLHIMCFSKNDEIDSHPRQHRQTSYTCTFWCLGTPHHSRGSLCGHANAEGCQSARRPGSKA